MNNQDQATTRATTDDFGKEVTIEALPHGKEDQMRISICTYKGARFVNLRVWFRGTDRRFRPTKTGITFQPTQLGRIIAALQETKRRFEQSAHDRERVSAASIPVAPAVEE